MPEFYSHIEHYLSSLPNTSNAEVRLYPVTTKQAGTARIPCNNSLWRAVPLPFGLYRYELIRALTHEQALVILIKFMQARLDVKGTPAAKDHAKSLSQQEARELVNYLYAYREVNTEIKSPARDHVRNLITVFYVKALVDILGEGGKTPLIAKLLEQVKLEELSNMPADIKRELNDNQISDDDLTRDINWAITTRDAAVRQNNKNLKPEEQLDLAVRTCSVEHFNNFMESMRVPFVKATVWNEIDFTKSIIPLYFAHNALRKSEINSTGVRNSMNLIQTAFRKFSELCAPKPAFLPIFSLYFDTFGAGHLSARDFYRRWHALDSKIKSAAPKDKDLMFAYDVLQEKYAIIIKELQKEVPGDLLEFAIGQKDVMLLNYALRKSGFQLLETTPWSDVKLADIRDDLWAKIAGGTRDGVVIDLCITLCSLSEEPLYKNLLKLYLANNGFASWERIALTNGEKLEVGFGSSMLFSSHYNKRNTFHQELSNTAQLSTNDPRMEPVLAWRDRHLADAKQQQNEAQESNKAQEAAQAKEAAQQSELRTIQDGSLTTVLEKAQEGHPFAMTHYATRQARTLLHYLAASGKELTEAERKLVYEVFEFSIRGVAMDMRAPTFNLQYRVDLMVYPTQLPYAEAILKVVAKSERDESKLLQCYAPLISILDYFDRKQGDWKSWDQTARQQFFAELLKKIQDPNCTTEQLEAFIVEQGAVRHIARRQMQVTLFSSTTFSLDPLTSKATSQTFYDLCNDLLAATKRSSIATLREATTVMLAQLKAQQQAYPTSIDAKLYEKYAAASTASASTSELPPQRGRMFMIGGNDDDDS